MQPESQTQTHAEERTAPSRDAFYWRRMLFIQRWRRIGWVICLFFALTALLFALLDPAYQHPSTVMLVRSMFAFIVSVVAAVNLLTFLLRK